MTANPFTAFAFEASGNNVNTSRTLPNRLTDITNVKDYGAVGDWNGSSGTDNYAAIWAAFNHGVITLTTTATNLTASFTGAIASASFNATISGSTTLTINSGLVGTVAIGHTVAWTDGVTNFSDTIASGSGSVWTLSHSQTSIGPVAMTTNTILTVSSAAGGAAIASLNVVLGTSVALLTQVATQQSGTTGGNGVYILDIPQNVASEAMTTVNQTLTFASIPAGITFNMYAADMTQPTILGSLTAAPSGNTITVQIVRGLVNIGDQISFISQSRGVIYFPPGNYYVSQPIDFTGLDINNLTAIWRGEPGVSIVTGNFADYVFKRTAYFSNFTSYDKLSVTNINATGGGIRAGGSLFVSLRDCTITANQGISTFNDDSIDAIISGSLSLEVSMENCRLSPGSNATNSQGIMSGSDGPIVKCTMVGYGNGMLLAGGEGSMWVQGCYFEQCTTGLLLAVAADGTLSSAGAVTVAGCRFKNCSTGIYIHGSVDLATIIGISIEGTNGQAPSGGDPQYGIYSPRGSIGNSMVAGVIVTGQYAVAAVSLASGSNGTNFMGIQASNSGAGVAWQLPSPIAMYLPEFSACNTIPIYTVGGLLAQTEGYSCNVSDGTNSLAWAAPLTNTGTHTTHYKAYYNGSGYTVEGQ